MNSTPAPVSTASAASIIWSGVGEVKTWPGHAASSMPRPTKPACSGSCPEPPPEISATLPGFNVRRRTNLRSAPSTRRSACAAAKPSRLSSRTVFALLISFFTSVLPVWSRVQINGSTDTFCKARELRGEIHDELLERAILLVVTKFGYGHRNDTRVRFAVGCAQSSGVRAAIRIEKCRTLGAGQMADFEDDRDMLRRDRHQISRIRDLAHERAILAQLRCKLQPGPRRPIVEHLSQDYLVFCDVLVTRRVLTDIVLHEPTSAIAALSRATAIGDTERVVSPVASSALVSRVSAAASPQRETSTPRFSPASTVAAISASTAGLLASLRSATAPMSRAAAIVYWVRSFEPM